MQDERDIDGGFYMKTKGNRGDLVGGTSGRSR